jgi:hypothetical protein
MKRSHQLMAVAALTTLASVASAKVIGSANGPNFFNFFSSGTFVPVTPDGSTTLIVNAPKAAVYVLTYSAECSVDAPTGNSAAIVDIDIEVNGVGLPPTDISTDTFCGADGVVGFSNFTHPSVTVLAPMNAGSNVVRVLGKFHGGATGGWISDSALVVHQ